MKKGPKKVLKGIAIALICLLVIVIGYVIYVKAAVYRLEDNLRLEVDKRTETAITPDDGFSVVTYNIGMGIYSRDFGFFMDGGKEGRAASEAEVIKNTEGAIATLQELNPDFILIEETGIDCTCNYHINQLTELKQAFGDDDAVFAQNWDSPYFAYPILCPFGKTVAGLTVLSRYAINASIRYSLPLEDSFTNFVDLDRCYTKNTIKTVGDKRMLLYCIHASAYTSDAETANHQIRLLIEDMLGEYEKGNYVIAGGDWNRTLDGDPEALYGVSTAEYSWLLPIDAELIPPCFYRVSGLDTENPVPSCRNADGPYDPATQARGNIDGFIVSDNLTVEEARVIDTDFEYSDHNPVFARFAPKK